MNKFIEGKIKRIREGECIFTKDEIPVFLQLVLAVWIVCYLFSRQLKNVSLKGKDSGKRR